MLTNFVNLLKGIGTGAPIVRISALVLVAYVSCTVTAIHFAAAYPAAAVPVIGVFAVATANVYALAFLFTGRIGHQTRRRERNQQNVR